MRAALSRKIPRLPSDKLTYLRLHSFALSNRFSTMGSIENMPAPHANIKPSQHPQHALTVRHPFLSYVDSVSLAGLYG